MHILLTISSFVAASALASALASEKLLRYNPTAVVVARTIRTPCLGERMALFTVVIHSFDRLEWARNFTGVCLKLPLCLTAFLKNLKFQDQHTLCKTEKGEENIKNLTFFPTMLTAGGLGYLQVYCMIGGYRPIKTIGKNHTKNKTDVVLWVKKDPKWESPSTLSFHKFFFLWEVTCWKFQVNLLVCPTFVVNLLWF